MGVTVGETGVQQEAAVVEAATVEATVVDLLVVVEAMVGVAPTEAARAAKVVRVAG